MSDTETTKTISALMVDARKAALGSLIEASERGSIENRIAAAKVLLEHTTGTWDQDGDDDPQFISG